MNKLAEIALQMGNRHLYTNDKLAFLKLFAEADCTTQLFISKCLHSFIVSFYISSGLDTQCWCYMAAPHAL